MAPQFGRPDGILADTHQTHPEMVEGGNALVSPTYQEPEEFLLTFR
jgi:hypothetical protein